MVVFSATDMLSLTGQCNIGKLIVLPKCCSKRDKTGRFFIPGSADMLSLAGQEMLIGWFSC